MKNIIKSIIKITVVTTIIVALLVFSQTIWVKKYHKIYHQSIIKNVYELYSGVSSYKGIAFFDSVIEYQIRPTFTGTKEECEARKKKNDIILDRWLEENYSQERNND